MAVILRGLIKLYYFLNEEIADKKTQDWPLMGSPWPGLFIISLYLLTILKFLPKYMENRPPLDLRKIMIIYNAVQVLGCIYVVYQSLRLGWFNHYKLVCQPVEDGSLAEEFAWKACYGYFVLKVVDLFDTIFFVLRKKQNQVSFLHVYHHFGMVIVAWGTVKWLPGGHTTFMLPLNSFIHVIMYSYYLITLWHESYKQSLWWKKYVTQIQILQFYIMLVHLLALAFAPQCEFPRQPAYILIPQNLFMVILFSDFYYRSYIKNDKIKHN